MRLIDANALKDYFQIGGDETSCEGCEHLKARGCYEERLLSDFCSAIDEQPTIDAVPLSVVRKAAKKLAYIHQQIDLYGDRPDLHDEEYWVEYLMDEEWKDEEID